MQPIAAANKSQAYPVIKPYASAALLTNFSNIPKAVTSAHLYAAGNLPEASAA